jgi:HPt (histidine-containing phosphotransfer) domain-containing protein
VTDGHGLPLELVSAFRARLRRDAARLATLRDALADEGAQALADDPHRMELEQLAHGLVGAGATFGFAEVTAAAEDVERLTGLRPALMAPADAECRRLLLLAVENLHLAVSTGGGTSTHG